MSSRLFLVASCTLILCARDVAAQKPTGPVYDSYRRASAIVARGLAAHGGAAAIRGLRGFDFRYDGFTYDREQQVHASDAFTPFPPRRAVGFRTGVDWTGLRQVIDFAIDAPGEGRVASRTITRGREQLRFRLGGTDQSYTRDSLSEGAPTSFPFQHQLMPPILLRQAVMRSSTLRYVGRRGNAASGEDIVTFANADGSVLAVGLDVKTGLVNTVETVGEIGLFGDGDHLWRFAEYRDAHGLRVPGIFRHYINGLIQEELSLVEARVNPPWADSTFAPPPAYALRVATGVAVPGGPSLIGAAPGVFYVEGLAGYRVMFVDAGETIIAVEAPHSARAAELALALIRRALPGKAVSHVVLTHHHLDHVAGARTFAEQGATIVVPRGMEDYIHRIVSGERTFGMLGLESRQVKPRVESVDSVRDLGPLRLHRVSTSHASSMLLVHHPEHRLLFQGDLARFPAASPLPPATNELIAWIRRLGLSVERIASVHGENGTLDDLLADRVVLSSRPRYWFDLQ